MEMIKHVHFLLSLEDAFFMLKFATGVWCPEDEWISSTLNLITAAVLDKESRSEFSEHDFFKAATMELERIGLSAPDAHGTVVRIFNTVAKQVTDAICDFGAERYRGKYDYEMRNRVDLYLAVDATAFDHSAG